MVEQGRLLGGKYRLGGVISTGEHALVVDAVHVELRERVAVKILQQTQSDPRLAARLRREARQATKIRSAHVVRYLDVGHLTDGRPYVVMERLSGETLADRIARAPLAMTQAIDVVLETCEALASAHARGIVHRDLRPSNLFCVKGPGDSFTIKVLNFGTARGADPLRGEEDEGLTVAALALDAPDYKAPEQIGAKRDLDGRVDIWSLGVVFYEMLTGRHPFTAPTLAETLRRILAADADRSTEIIPLAWDVIARCLRPNREERWPDVARLAEAIGPLAGPATASYAERIQHILSEPPSADADESDESIEDIAPTLVRDVLALGGGSPSTTLSPGALVTDGGTAVRARAGGSLAALPQLDDGHTGARSFPWLELPEGVVAPESVRDPHAPPPRRSSTSISVLLLVGASVILVTVLALSRRDAKRDARHDAPVATATATAAPAVVTAPAPSAAPTETAVVPPARAAVTAPVDTAPAAPRAAARPPAAGQRPATRPKPTAAAAGDDPWGWER